jgi:hypothetical protein
MRIIQAGLSGFSAQEQHDAASEEKKRREVTVQQVWRDVERMIAVCASSGK